MPTLENWELPRFVIRPQVRSSLPADPAQLTPEQREELLRLGDSLAEKQLQPVGAYTDGSLYWGFRRVMAAKLKGGLKTLMTLVFDKPLTDAEIKIWQLVENMGRENLSPIEAVHGLIELSKLAIPRKDIAAKVHLDPGNVTRLLSYLDCADSVRQAFDAGTICVAQMYSISKLPPEKQAEALTLALGGANRDELENHRKRRPAQGEKVDRFNIPLPTGTIITIKGSGLSFDDGIEAVTQLLAEMKDYRKKIGTDPKAFIATMKDKAVATA